MVATCPWRMRSASGRKPTRPMISRSRCASDRWWRWHAANGTGPRSLPARQVPFCTGPGSGELFATPLICALRARAAIRREDVPAARRELLSAQHLRPLLTYALPYLAVQARIELARVHLALTDLAGARTLMCEVDDLLSAGRPRDPRRGGRGTPGPAVQGPRCKRPRSVGADRCRAAPAAAAVHPPVVPGDRRGDVPVPQHDQVAGDVDLPQAGGLLTQPGSRPVPCELGLLEG